MAGTTVSCSRCGARLAVPPGVRRLVCDRCGAHLTVRPAAEAVRVGAAEPPERRPVRPGPRPPEDAGGRPGPSTVTILLIVLVALAAGVAGLAVVRLSGGGGEPIIFFSPGVFPWVRVLVYVAFAVGLGCFVFAVVAFWRSRMAQGRDEPEADATDDR